MTFLLWFGYLLACWLGADLVAGFFHWFEDRYLDADTPILGPLVGGPNVEHHSRPNAFLVGNYWYRNWTTIVPAAIVALLVYPHPAWLVFLFATQANEVHAWAHQRCSWPIKMLQDTGLLQSAKHHGGHHKAPFDCRYCVMTDILNPLLDTFRVWSALEWLLARCGLEVKK